MEERLAKSVREQQERKSRKDSKLRHHFRDTHTLGTVQLTHTKEAHHEV